MRIRLPSARWLLAGWFVGLALLIAGPLLGPGHLMLLDFVGGPQAPSFSYMPLPSSDEVGNAIPFLTVQAALGWVHPYLLEKLLLLAPIVLGGLGIARFALRRLEVGPLPAAYAGTLYAVNPFVYDRLTAGHLYLLVAYGLLPWAFATLVGALEEPRFGRDIAVALWLAALTAVDLHVAGMFALLVVLGHLVSAGWRGLVRATVALGLAALLSAYWLVPSMFAPPGSRIGLADLEVYASEPHGPQIIPVLLGLNGFWRGEFASATERVPVLALLLIPILSLAGIGAGRLVQMRRHRAWAIALLASAIVALLVAAGVSFPPTAGLARWSFERLPGLGVYREPQKLVAILALAYPLFGAVGASALIERIARRGSPVAAITRATVTTAVLVAATLTYTYPILWGLWGETPLARFPTGWQQAEVTMSRIGPGRLLVLPWNLYGVRSFAHPRITADPALSYFSEEMLSNHEAGFEEVPLQSGDPFAAYVARIIERRDDVRALGHLLAPLGVRYVVLFHEIDWQQYGFVRRQSDLDEIYRDSDLELYENAAWRGDVLPLEAGRSVGGPAELIGGPEEARVTESLFLAPPLVPPTGGGIPAIADILPGATTIAPSDASHVATGVRCTDGWRLGTEEADCLLGAVAAFPTPAEARPLRSGLTGTWVVGYAASALTLAAMVTYGGIRASPGRSDDGHGTQRRRGDSSA